MCRFALYLGPPILLKMLINAPVNSIVQQSIRSSGTKQTVNGDGFGVAWYAPEIGDPALFTSINPAWNNQNLLHLSRVTESRCILAHVRSASPGLAVAQLNCHPFVHGRLAFMHNGMLGSFEKIRRQAMERLSDTAFEVVQGSTDTELMFALFVDQLARSPEDLPARRLAHAMVATIRQIEEITAAAGGDEPSLLNLAVSDGECAVVTRYASHDPDRGKSLWVATGSRYQRWGGKCRMVQAKSGESAVLIASEPLNRGPAWRKVAGNHLVMVNRDLEVSISEV